MADTQTIRRAPEQAGTGGHLPMQTGVALLAAGALLLLTFAAYGQVSPRHAAAALIGGLAGLGLYHASFGFTSAWRRLVVEKKGRGLRAQVLLLLTASAVVFPLIAWGGSLGIRANGFVFPFGISAAIGAFLFGVGMQFGGGCASGTLFTAGGGSTRMIVTLAAFIGGSVWATAHMPFWSSLPSLGSWSLVQASGPVLAWLITAAILGAAVLFSIWLERQAHGSIEPLAAQGQQRSFFRGPWSPEAGALLLALVSVLTVLALGRPWGITSGFALWGAKVLDGLGVDVGSWAYWQGQTRALENSLLYDATSVMNFGILLGALLAAGLAGKFAPVWRIAPKDLATAIFGGLLMGYGARLAYGCNIGAYLGGIISGSLHGWLWLVFGFAGSSLGVWCKRALRI